MRENNGWICTDPDSNQYRKDISKNVFLFKEDRQIDFLSLIPKYEVYELEIDLADYSEDELLDYTTPYYPEEEVRKWILEGENGEIIAECIFEQSYD